jgi:uncharacterized tellurite resistance protein B-like protein
MMHMMLADGNIEDSEVETIRGVYTQLANTELSAAQVQQQIKEIEAAGDGVLDDLQATEAIGMSAAHVRGVLAEIKEGQPSG